MLTQVIRQNHIRALKVFIGICVVIKAPEPSTMVAQGCGVVMCPAVWTF